LDASPSALVGSLSAALTLRFFNVLAEVNALGRKPKGGEKEATGGPQTRPAFNERGAGYLPAKLDRVLLTAR